jgi:hypothetical protein
MHIDDLKSIGIDILANSFVIANAGRFINEILSTAFRELLEHDALKIERIYLQDRDAQIFKLTDIMDGKWWIIEEKKIDGEKQVFLIDRSEFNYENIRKT